MTRVPTSPACIAGQLAGVRGQYNIANHSTNPLIGQLYNLQLIHELTEQLLRAIVDLKG